MPKYRAYCLLLACLTCPGFAEAQTPTLITDRPDFTESPFVVPRGSIQVEAGLTRVMHRRRPVTSGPETLVRWSPARAFELRFEPPGYVSAESPRGLTDVSLGMKVEVGRVGAWSLGTIASVGLPTGEDGVSAGRVVPQIVVAAGRGLGEVWSLGSQASVGRPDEGRGFTLASTLVAGRALTQRIGAFLEVAIEREPGTSVATLLHGGFTLLAAPMVQLDLHAARRVSGVGRSTSVGLGLSTRFR